MDEVDGLKTCPAFTKGLLFAYWFHTVCGLLCWASLQRPDSIIAILRYLSIGISQYPPET
jgi:hypothetical protein